MFYTVYQITNLVNGKVYVGVHQTKKLDDNYMGSGKVLKHAIAKHGIQNFKREYLAIFDNAKDMFQMEAQIVNSDFVRDPQTYNVKEGGEGGWDARLKIASREHSIAVNQKFRDRIASDPDLQEKYHAMGHKLVESNSTNPKWRKNHQAFMKGNQIWVGRKHSDEVREKISQGSKGKLTGDRNGQFGKIWVHSLEQKKSIRIKPEEFASYQLQGWLKGRKMRFDG